MRQRLRLLLEEGKADGAVRAVWPLLALLSFFYSLCVRGMRLFYRSPAGNAYRPRAKVVSVGNITLGGTGKTPLVRLIAEYLYSRDKRVAVLLRGYRRPGAGTRDFDVLGDEGAWLKRVLVAKADVFAASDRRRLAREVDARGGYDVFLLDDGFQHWRLRRDLDIVAVDATRGLGNGFLIPAGPLREEAGSLRRAAVICLTRTDEVPAPAGHVLRQRLARLAPQALLVELAVRPEAVVRAATGARVDAAQVRGKKAGLLCAIGNPASFLRTAQGLGIDVVYHRFFEDHHAVTRQELADVLRVSAQRGAQTLVMTGKDAARLEGALPEEADIWVVEAALAFVRGREHLYGRLDSLFSL
ncbi:MAG: tetraacyldisaccharide 4'-kinase [Deltaproteobacteria bacterium]